MTAIKKHLRSILPVLSFLTALSVIVGCGAAGNRTSAGKAATSDTMKKELNLAESIDTSTYSSSNHNYIKGLPEPVINNLTTVFKEALAFQDSATGKQFARPQMIRYNDTTLIRLVYYFRVGTYTLPELLSQFNLMNHQNPWTQQISTDLDTCRRTVWARLRFPFLMDSVKVESPFRKFNLRFSNYIQGHLNVMKTWWDTRWILTADSVSFLHIDILNANEDEYPDMLVNDIIGEHGANAITDFWIYAPGQKELIHEEKLGTPVWDIDREKRIFYSGWHMSASESNEWCFKIRGTKAVKLKDCR